MKDKLRIYHESYIEREIKHQAENQLLALLQFFYITRLAQFGLFSAIQIDNATDKLFAVTDFSDQLIGASVYAAKDSLHKTRTFKRKFVFEALRKFETGSEERVTTENNVTFKQLKALFDDIWSNTIDEKKNSEKLKLNGASWIVVPAHGTENGTANNFEQSEKLTTPPSIQTKEVDNGVNGEHDASKDDLLSRKSRETGSKVESAENEQLEIKEGEPDKVSTQEKDADFSKDEIPAQENTYSKNDVSEEKESNPITKEEDLVKTEDFTREKDSKAQIEESVPEVDDVKETLDTEDGFHDDLDHDSEKKSAESDPSAGSWRYRSSENNLNGRGRGSTSRGFKRGGGRGRFTKDRGIRSRRGRGRGYDVRD